MKVLSGVQDHTLVYIYQYKQSDFALDAISFSPKLFLWAVVSLL